jgi:alkylhydroperoxidase family enzyme
MVAKLFHLRSKDSCSIQLIKTESGTIMHPSFRIKPISFTMLRTSLQILSLVATGLAVASEPAQTSRPIPVTRPEMKQLLEDMKSRRVRIPLPMLTEEQELQQQVGDHGSDYESRLRFHYLPESEGFAFGRRSTSSTATGLVPTGPTAVRDMRRNSDENMSLSYEFKTQLFWIVSRTNNCQYCLGHQEQKLSAAGIAEETIAALDFDWDKFTPAEQAAFHWSRKITWTPHRIQSQDIEVLREHFTDLQILEMTMSVAGNNAINRWKEGTGVPQSDRGTRFFDNVALTAAPEHLPIDTFLTPTASKYRNTPSIVAAIAPHASGGSSVAIVGVPAINETPEQVREHLEQMKARRSRLPLCSTSETREAFSLDENYHPPAWMRLMAHFPVESKRRIQSFVSYPTTHDDLSSLDRARVSWVVARQDRAWYATALAMKSLTELGQTESQIFELDGDLQSLPETERALLNVARKLATSPITLGDDDVAKALELAGPRRVTQLIHFVASRAYFNRVSEAAGLSVSEDDFPN